MENIESPAKELEDLFERVETYSRTSYELVRLKSIEGTAEIATTLVVKLVVVMTFAIFILVLSIGIALFLGDILGKPFYGFFIMAAFYLLTSVILYHFLKSWIRNYISLRILKQAQP